MSDSTTLRYKIADSASEFDQIHRLNYRTFVEEIPQHAGNGNGILIDKFHDRNTYAICLDGDRLIGMLALNDSRPFSLDQKLPDLDAYLPAGSRPVEVRLLAVEPAYRHQRVLQGLLQVLIELGAQRSWDHAVISGVKRQSRLYGNLGFTPFGPPVGNGEATFQPMQLTLEGYRARLGRIAPDPRESASHKSILNLLPGPVAITHQVSAALGEAPISHRSARFMTEFQEVRDALLRLTHARHVEIFPGSGTLANDVVAGQLSLLKGEGLIISNGEFGERLIDHARRWSLRFTTLRYDWGESIEVQDVEQRLGRNRGIEWLWMTHCETSSGILNDIDMIGAICLKCQIRLCLDLMSSLNIVPINLSNVFLASATSGKGLAAFPGLALIFYNRLTKAHSRKLPRALDLGYYAAHRGVPFTISSNLIHALKTALGEAPEARQKARVSMSGHLKQILIRHGFTILAQDKATSPGVITIALPPSVSSLRVGEYLEMRDCWLSYRSGYLLRRNLVQICLMGEHTSQQVDGIPLLLEEAVRLSEHE